jgi:hypothetical protein
MEASIGGGVLELVPLGPEFGVEVRRIGLIDVAVDADGLADLRPGA